MWSLNNSIHHPLPSWGTEQATNSEIRKISSNHTSAFFSFPDVYFRLLSFVFIRISSSFNLSLDVEKIIFGKTNCFCLHVFVQYRSEERPIDHRNSISLTIGPYNLPPTADTNCSAETQISKIADVNDLTMHLLDSLEQNNDACSSRDEPISEASGTTQIKSLDNPHLRYSDHQQLPDSNASFACSSQAAKTDSLFKVTSDMATMPYFSFLDQTTP